MLFTFFMAGRYSLLVKNHLILISYVGTVGTHTKLTFLEVSMQVALRK